MGKLRDLTGQRFGRLTVTGRAEDYCSRDCPEKRFTQWLCDCDCGEKGIVVLGANLRHGHTRSCGCWRKELARERLENQTGRKKREEP